MNGGRRPWIVVAALNGLSAVALGAYAAHGLAAEPYAQALAERAALYQMVHALAILVADRLASERRSFAHAACALFTLGIVAFSGSLYLKALGGTPPFSLATPFGGIAFMLGWLALAAAALQRSRA